MGLGQWTLKSLRCSNRSFLLIGENGTRRRLDVPSTGVRDDVGDVQIFNFLFFLIFYFSSSAGSNGRQLQCLH